METPGNEGSPSRGLVAFAAGTTLDVLAATAHLGIGLAAIAFDSVRKLGAEALERGAAIEREGREALVEFERENVARMKDYLRRDRAGAQGDGIEARVEQALATFDVPTRDDIRELHAHLASLGDKINRLPSS